MSNKENMLGTESVGKLLFKMATPAILAQLVNMLYNIVDRMFIGKIPEIGTTALTGVGITFPIIILTSAFASLIGMGGSPRAAIKMGANDYDEAENILGNCFISLIFISITLTILFEIFHEPLLISFGASEKTLPYAEEYIRIYSYGTIFVQMALGLNSFISCQGFPKVSMRTILIGAILNIFFDFLFIKVFNMGVKGAALATVISQAASAIWVIRFLMFSKNSRIKIKRKYFKIKKDILLSVLTLGISPFIMQSTESILNIAFNSSLEKHGGDIAVGTMTILTTIMQCVNLPCSGLGQGAQPIISYNYGAGNKERIQKTFRLLIISALTYTISAWLLIMIKPEILITLFAKEGEDIVGYASWAIRIYLFGAFIMGAQYSCQQTFIALGMAKESLFLAIFRKIILLVPLIYILP
ncbi:MAG: MATE family efflux transporter, partial [Eubacteriales bacterium]|nr:MATE family efflux transporter [Eubacteriales bacterium]